MWRPLASTRTIAFCMLMAVFWSGLRPAAAQTADLLTVYQQAEATSPALARTRSLLQSSHASRLVVRSALLPKLGARAGVNDNNVNLQGFGADFLPPSLPISTDIKDTYMGGNYSVSLTQPIINGQAWMAMHAAAAQIRAAQAAVLACQQILIRQVVQTYFSVLQARADVRVVIAETHLLKEILDQTKAALRVGSGGIIAVQEARARYDAAVSTLVRVRNRVQIARQRLQRLTHCELGPLTDLGPLQPRGPQPNRMGPWLQAAKRNQPLLAEARQQLQAARDQIEVARRGHWPTLSLDAGYGYIKGDFLPSIDSRQAQVGLTLNVPIFEGGEIVARTQRARAEAMASQYQLEDLRDRVKLDTENAFLDLRNSVAEFRAAVQTRLSANIALAGTRKGYEVGSRSIIDLLTSVQNYERAQRDYYLALYNQVVARVRLKAAAGVINIKDIEAINTLLEKDSEKGSQKWQE